MSLKAWYIVSDMASQFEPNYSSQEMTSKELEIQLGIKLFQVNITKN